MPRCNLITMVLLGAIGSCGSGCPGPAPPGPPEPDACDHPPVGATVDSLDIGPDGEPFAALQNGDVMQLVYGGQGFAMLPVRLRVSGLMAPACLLYTADVSTIAGGGLAGSSGAVNAYDDEGAKITSAIYLVLSSEPNYASEVLLHATAGGLTLERRVWIGAVGTE